MRLDASNIIAPKFWVNSCCIFTPASQQPEKSDADKIYSFDIGHAFVAVRSRSSLYTG